jgi:hypothetical protein
VANLGGVFAGAGVSIRWGGLIFLTGGLEVPRQSLEGNSHRHHWELDRPRLRECVAGLGVSRRTEGLTR